MWDKFKVKNLLLLARVNHFAVTVFHLIPQRVFVLTGIYQQSLLLLDPIPLVKNKSNSAVMVFHLIPQRVFVLTGIYQQGLLLLDPIPLVKNKSNSAVMVLHLIQMGHVQMMGHRNQVLETILHYHLSQIKPLF
jgi:hypothetical protein